MGVNQSHEGVRTAQAIINLALMTGNIGRPGTGPTRSPASATRWARGCSATRPSLLGGRDFTNADHRRDVADDSRASSRGDPQR